MVPQGACNVSVVFGTIIRWLLHTLVTLCSVLRDLSTAKHSLQPLNLSFSPKILPRGNRTDSEMCRWVGIREGFEFVYED